MKDDFIEKLCGAVTGRFAGCCLGAPVELMGFVETRDYAGRLGIGYPPLHYWPESPGGEKERYKVGKFNDFTSGRMKFLPPDDDIIYTIIPLLVVERYGRDFSTADIAELWLELLPLECTYTAERIALTNLKAGIHPLEAGGFNNPDKELIGAAIRCDGWAYMNPGHPEKAAEMAFRDAWLTHRGSGIHSAIFFSASISLAFVNSNLLHVFKEALGYVPAGSYFREQMEWALDISGSIDDYAKAYEAVTSRFPDMDPVHSVNNACLVIWGSLLGRNNFTKGISQTVAMGYDNDCTTATVGSILGACLGIDAVDEKWYKPWNNSVRSYLIGMPEFRLDDIIDRFSRLAER